MSDEEAQLLIRKYLSSSPVIGDVVKVRGFAGLCRVAGQYAAPMGEYYYVEQSDGAMFISMAQHMAVVRRDFE